MATEIEMKLKVPSPAVMEQVLADPGLTEAMRDSFEVIHMASIYYDTPTGDLSARKWTLRLRSEGDNRIVAMKTANMSGDFGISTRNEWQCSADSVEDAIPLLIEQGAPRELKNVLKGRTLEERCRAEFDRKYTYLYMDDGVRIELAGDTGRLFGGNKEAPICELELELLFGGAGALPPICNRLIADYGLEEEQLSKYERAAGLCGKV